MEYILDEESVKILVVGARSVGKTSFIKRFVEDKFSEKVLSSPCVNYYYRRLDIKDRSILVHIYDAPSTKEYENLTELYYKSVDAIIIIYDVTNTNLGAGVSGWLEGIRRYQSNTAICVVGNKNDMSENFRAPIKQKLPQIIDLHYLVSCKYPEGTNDRIWSDIVSIIDVKQKNRSAYLQGGSHIAIGLPASGKLCSKVKKFWIKLMEKYNFH